MDAKVDVEARMADVVRSVNEQLQAAKIPLDSEFAEEAREYALAWFKRAEARDARRASS